MIRLRRRTGRVDRFLTDMASIEALTVRASTEAARLGHEGVSQELTAWSETAREIRADVVQMASMTPDGTGAG